ncbi:hypothetical protein EDD22DRAFT_911447 [Suillus occidentalis]|nr:hypothetical protein EDD22DRAFT_911447 [Suillus occidentalis]
MPICFVFPCLLRLLGAASCSNSRSAAGSARSRRTQDCCVTKCYTGYVRLGGNVKIWTCSSGTFLYAQGLQQPVALHDRESCVRGE